MSIRKWLSAVAFIASAVPGVTLAADVNLKSAYPVATSVAPSAYNWSGWYLTANAGWGWRSSFSTPSSSYYSALGVDGLDPAPGSSKHDGATFGVGFGYDRQIGWFVWGLEYDFQWASLGDRPNQKQRYFTKTGSGGGGGYDIYGNPIGGGSTVGYTVLNYDATDGDGNRWYGLILGRAGVAYDRFFVFGLFGAAYRFSYDYTDPYVVTSNGSVIYYSGYNTSNSWGWAAGVGAQYAINKNINVKIDWVHMDFGNASYVDPIASAATNTVILYSTKKTADLVRFGVNIPINIPLIGGY